MWGGAPSASAAASSASAAAAPELRHRLRWRTGAAAARPGDRRFLVVTERRHRRRDEHDLDVHGGWPGLLTELLAGRDLTADQARAAMATILAGERHAGPADRLRRRPAGQGRDRRRAVRTARRRAGGGRAGAARRRPAGAAPSTSSAPAATARTRSTCRRWRRSSSPAPACRCASTAPAARRRSAARPTCSRRSAWRIELTPDGRAALRRGGRDRVLLRAPVPPGVPLRRPGSRREIGIPTVFNLLGPMANPGRVRRQLIGVADARFAERMLASLRAHGSTDAWVVHGGGLDELTTTGPSTVLALAPRRRRPHVHRRPGRARARAGHPRPARRRRPGAQRRRRAPGARRRARRRTATSSCSTPPPRWSSPARPTTSPAGLVIAEQSIDSGKAAGRPRGDGRRLPGRRRHLRDRPCARRGVGGRIRQLSAARADMHGASANS